MTTEPERDPLEIWPGQDWRRAAGMAGIETAFVRDATIAFYVAADRRDRALAERRGAHEQLQNAARAARPYVPVADMAEILGDDPTLEEDF